MALESMAFFPHCLKELLAHSHHSMLTGLTGRELQAYLPPLSPVTDHTAARKEEYSLFGDLKFSLCFKKCKL